MNRISVDITYDAFKSNAEFEDFEGIEDFKRALSESYISRVKPHGVGRGGGAYELIIDVLLDISFKDFMNFVVSGIAWDLIRDGVKRVNLRPLLEAFDRLNKSNGGNLCIAEFVLKFEETEVSIKSVNDRGIYAYLPEIMQALITEYSSLKSSESGLFPERISIPVLYDGFTKKYTDFSFREPLLEEEYLTNLDKTHYFKFWGLDHNIHEGPVVYDLEKHLLTKNFYATAEIFMMYHYHNIKFE